jgi:ABC-type nitrate/sulfonate/bicarbonate transport system ATPase subunit
MQGVEDDRVSMAFALPGGGSVHALRDVTLRLRPGELMCVLGRSGCGETTLLNISPREHAPSRATARCGESAGKGTRHPLPAVHLRDA